jgi:hypothetical protein
MNEQIKELESKAYVEVTRWLTDTSSGCGSEVMFLEFSREKFAELIVQECYSLIVKNAPRVTCKEDFHLGYVLDGYMDAADLIKQHFGVEE